MTELDRMQAGEWYNGLDPALEELRQKARRAVWAHNTMHPDQRGAAAPELRALLGAFGENSFLEAPIHVAYGFNLYLAENCYMNAGCVVLDCAAVHIGPRSMLGPQVKLFCPEHHQDPLPRSEGQEIARPITLGADVWVGGGATILGGVNVGDGAIIGAGAVVTRDVEPGARVTGVPAKPR